MQIALYVHVMRLENGAEFRVQEYCRESGGQRGWLGQTSRGLQCPPRARDLVLGCWEPLEGQGQLWCGKTLRAMSG